MLGTNTVLFRHQFFQQKRVTRPKSFVGLVSHGNKNINSVTRVSILSIQYQKPQKNLCEAEHDRLSRTIKIQNDV